MKDSRWWYYAAWVMVVLYFMCLIAFNIVSLDRTVDDMIYWGFMTIIMVVAVFGCIIVGVLMEQNESYRWASRMKKVRLLGNLEKQFDEIDKEKGVPKGAE